MKKYIRILLLGVIALLAFGTLIRLLEQYERSDGDL